MATTYMNLTLPTEFGSANVWGALLNTLETTVDAHDHSSGKGKRVTPAGLDIDVDLSFAGNDATNVRSVRFTSQGSALAAGSDVGCISNIAGNLYWNNNSGTAIQITSGGGLNTAALATTTFANTTIAAHTTIQANDTFVLLKVNTTSARTITLPAIAGVTTGRFYIVKDVSGQSETNAITLDRTGSDTIDGVGGSMSLSMDLGMWIVVSDGSSNWMVMRPSPDFLTKTTLTLGSTVLNTTSLSTGTGTFSSHIATGASPASDGDVRLSNAGWIRSNKADGSGDVLLIRADSSNDVTIGGGSNPGKVVIQGVGSVQYLGNTHWFRTDGAAGTVATLTATTASFVGNIEYASAQTVTKQVPGAAIHGRTNSAINDGGDIDASYLPLTSTHGSFDRNTFITGTPNTGTDAAYQFYMPISAYLAHGATLTSAVLTINPTDGHAGLPGCMPKVAIARSLVSDGEITGLLSTGFAADTTASAGAYDAVHTITFTPDQNNVIDLENYTYFAVIQDAGSTNADVMRINALKLVYTLTSLKGGL